MAYFKVITSAQTWTCPAAGDYKIICVGAGGDGAASGVVGCAGAIAEAVVSLAANATVACSFTSGVAAFGSHLSAAKGGTFTPFGFVNGTNRIAMGGEGGYTLDGVYGGVGEKTVLSATDNTPSMNSPATKNGGAAGRTGFGYGAGGGAYLYDNTSDGNNKHTNGAGGAIIIAGM